MDMDYREMKVEGRIMYGVFSKRRTAYENAALGGTPRRRHFTIEWPA